jgi:hypothetical protein
MDKSTWFWLMMFFVLVFGAWDGYTTKRWSSGVYLFVFLALVLLGWQVFGNAIK